MEEKLAESSKEGRTRAEGPSPAAGAGFWDGSQVGQEGQRAVLTGIVDTSEAQRDVGNRALIPVGRIFRKVGVKAAGTPGKSVGPQ